MAAAMEGEVGKMRLLDECAWDGREEVVLYCAAIYHCQVKLKAGSDSTISLPI